MSKIVFITAVPETISAFLIIYINSLAETHDVHIATTLLNNQKIVGLSSSVTTHHINITRAPNVFADVKSLFQLFYFFKKEKFDVVHSFTPKAGLLSQVAGFFARTPYRFHTFTGQVWVTKSGLARLLLKYLDKVTATFSTYCLVDSPSQRNFLIKEKLLTENNSRVLAKGSVSGINIDKFSFSQTSRNQLRKEHNVSNDDFVFLFVGRLKVDKGVCELINAFKAVETNRSIKLFILGSDEDQLTHLFKGVKNIEYIGFKSNVSDYYSFADFLCLPSHREGFGNVIIEAAACGLPAIASDIYGLCDAVENGYSGLLHDVKQEASIKTSMEQVLSNDFDLNKMKTDARNRVVNTFDEKHLKQAFLDFYNEYI